MASTERAYTWDEGPIDNPAEGGGEFTLLPAGVYPFTVTKFERSRHEGSAKLPPCPKAIVTVEIDGGDLGTTTRSENLFLHTKCEGLLSAFFKAIGHRRSGDQLIMNWSRVPGTNGMCKVGIRDYTKKDGTPGKSNEVKAWLEPDATPTPHQPSATPQPENDDLPF